MIASLKYKLVLAVKNMPGPRIPEKVVVIESDDHGSIRMPSQQVYRELQDAGIPVTPSRYHRYDTLEHEADLGALFEVLQSVKDHTGRAAVYSPFVNVANPDFDRIRNEKFSAYYCEPFPVTMEKYGLDSGRIMSLWRQGMDSGLFLPEYHGREHVSFPLWMRLLQRGNPLLLKAFDMGFVSVSNIPGIPEVAQEFRPAFYFNDPSARALLLESIADGVRMFRDLFRELPSSFMPTNSLFPPDFESAVFAAGIPFLNVGHSNPYPDETGQIRQQRYTFRQRYVPGRLNYYIRNCAFEPNDESYRSVASTLQQVAAAFQWGKAAIISTHRVNFAGGISERNRQEGLAELKKLLKALVTRWPEVRFMGSGEFLRTYVMQVTT